MQYIQTFGTQHNLSHCNAQCTGGPGGTIYSVFFCCCISIVVTYVCFEKHLVL